MTVVRAVQFDFPGGRETLRYREAPEPELASGEVLVRFEASAVNPADLKISGGSIAPRAGTSPYTLGWDIVGTIERRADGAETFEVGDRVVGMVRMASTGRGTWSQFVAVPAASITLAPAAIEPAVLAQLPLVGLTALKAIEKLAPSAGDRVLVVGAGGAVGGCTVQMLARLGVECHALVRTPEQAEQLRTNPSIAAVYCGEAPADSFHSIIDAAGIDASAAVRAGGTYITCVPGTLPDQLESKGAAGATAIVPESGSQIALLLDHLADGSLHLQNPDIFRLDDFEAALTSFASRTGRRTVLVA
ncbi:alcohol dehydrogenase catalytic domain-containing protein [Subtercola endophyticus]|uniref:alcohol dehydrogenase catalytic domain-containing protein n=1 Tax=Subtercola endophyticus TaxID=2895559 RepID=UPI001E3B79D4|nr:alcohol dehydrogenase catalytic domain-containing protein [Subtercola endophyticus]UFS58340.1 alcohol dehydrogenase catalytic domain-containing protein [Subtercola endophyticus]